MNQNSIEIKKSVYTEIIIARNNKKHSTIAGNDERRMPLE